VKSNPLLKLSSLGQSIWLDFIRRGMLEAGELKQLIDEDGLRGVTSNPSIFDKAIAGSHDYDAAIQALAFEGRSVQEIYQVLTVDDVQRATDLFRSIHDQTGGRDGFVSLEVSPHLAYDTEGTIAEAKRLWAALDRPNALIKVPATIPGLEAIRQLISEGINVNVTLLFGLPRYREVADAYLEGLEARAAHGGSIERIASVASFFLSRIDVLIDPMLEKLMEEGGPRGEVAGRLHGQVAVASARIAYEMYKEIFGGERFRELADKGAATQRLLWASTSTKNPAYSDVKYVEALIGPETVNTLPLETLNAYRDHGNPALRLEEGVEESRETLHELEQLGISLEQATQQLEEEGVQKFIKPFDRLMDTLEKERSSALHERPDRQVFVLGEYGDALQKRLADLKAERFVARLWRKDASLWKSDPENQEVIGNALGWLHVAEKMEENLAGLSEFVSEVRSAGLRQVVHMGMGGSSLAPLVFQRTFSPAQGALPLTVLDTTDPDTILEVQRKVREEETLFIVASKSGTTAEPLAFGDYFYARIKSLKGDSAGENFIAITDPGTPLADLAQVRRFRRTFLNFHDIGGRYSALSYFGLVPASLMGIDVAELLARALQMVHASASCLSVEQNPGVLLGAVMGELAKRGRDKVTFIVPEQLATVGMWLEQLLAESTGKENTGLLPVAGEPLGNPDAYGQDRFFAYLRLRDEVDQGLEVGVAALRSAAQPVVTIDMDDLLDLGQELFRWEIAVATAGSILGINAFNQPNVQESKDNTNRLLSVLRERGQLPETEPALVDPPLQVYAGEVAATVSDTLKQFLSGAHPGDYVALLAYLTESPSTGESLEKIRTLLRDHLQLATTVGYGPRFLHSTGQFHKGGPNTGLFLQLTVDEHEDVPIPGQPYTFGDLRRAQAMGDLEALRKHGRRVIWIHLGSDVAEGLSSLKKHVESALGERP
jgi:transaldolase/glucose-6-phosphate isomerase